MSRKRSRALNRRRALLKKAWFGARRSAGRRLGSPRAPPLSRPEFPRASRLPGPPDLGPDLLVAAPGSPRRRKDVLGGSGGGGKLVMDPVFPRRLPFWGLKDDSVSHLVDRAGGSDPVRPVE